MESESPVFDGASRDVSEGRVYTTFQRLPPVMAEIFPVASSSFGSLLPRTREPTGAAVFLHGFGGDPMATWGEFPIQAKRHPVLGNLDFYFLGYRSVRRQLGSLSNDLRSILRAIHSGRIRSSVLARPEGPAPVSTPYRKLLLIGHSEGGFLLRDAVLQDLNEPDGWVRASQNILFAPAHCGHRLTPLATFIFALLKVSHLVPLAEYRVPALLQLAPNSPHVEKLREETETLAAANPGVPALRAHCVFGAEDLVVVADHFRADRRRTPDVPSHGHSTVCKPTADWKWPLTYVSDCGGTD